MVYYKTVFKATPHN